MYERDCATEGSTPRMRGIFFRYSFRVTVHGFNPAYAGNIISSKVTNTSIQVQPRVCGEYVAIFSQLDLNTGSTPRMRGISCSCVCCSVNSRFNPAYAGNIILLIVQVRCFQVQPRVCGEYSKAQPKNERRTGSTPRMRGILRLIMIQKLMGRFNPAYAGNIEPEYRYFRYVQVQPRVCGEYLLLN